ncbi:MAG: PAS domain-containing protein [Dechloromonas sp.]|nr:PAS domain-containing protein [Dechloromonas sp.]
MKTAFIRDGILLRSILVTILAFCLVGVVTVAYTMQSARAQAEAQSRERIEQLLDTVQSTLRVAGFVKDRELAREVAQGLLSNPVVLRVTISESGNQLVDLARGGQPPSGEIQAGSLVRDIHSPFVDGEIIGAIRLTPDPDVIERQIRTEIVDRTWQLVWQLALIAGVMVVTLLAFVIHPITSISRELHRMKAAAGDRLRIPAGHSKTEIGRLVTDINVLADDLVRAIDEEHALRLKQELDEQKYHAIFDNAESGIFLIERNGRVASWNPALARLLGIARANEFTGQLVLLDLPWSEPTAIGMLIERVFVTGEAAERDLMLQRPDRTHFWLNIVLSPVGDDLLQGVAHDVSAHK